MDERQGADAAPEGLTLTVRQAAGLLGVREAQIRRMLREGVLVGCREGRAWRIDAEAVRAYEQAQATDANDRKRPPAGDAAAAAVPMQEPPESRTTRPEQPSGNQQTPVQPTAQATAKPTMWRYRVGRRARQLLYARPRLAGPVRRLLASLARYAEHADGLRVFRRRDAEENTRYALPDGERPMLAAIWTVELYTPSAVAGLLDALERHTWLRTRGGPDPARWIEDHRGRPGAGGCMTLARVVPPRTDGLLLDAIIGEVPEGFASIHLAIVALSSTLTGIVGCFVPTDEFTVSLDTALRREQQTTTPPNPSGGWSIHGVEHHKRAAADAIRLGARRAAVDWMQTYLPGVFARGLLAGDMPTLDLILTETVEPLLDNPGPRRPDRAWLDLLDLDTSFLAWICQDVAGLKAALPRSVRSDHEQHLTLAAQRNQLFRDEQLDDPQKRDRQELVWRLDADYLAPLAARWAIDGLLSGIERRLARIRDLAERSSHRRSIPMLDQLRRELLAVGLDGHIVAADIVAFATEAARYDHGVLEFVEAWTPTPSVGGTPAPPATIPAALRDHQHERAQGVLDGERQLREVLGATSNLASAVTNLRLQRLVAVLAVISTAAAIIATIAAILALNLSQPSAPPTTSSPAPYSTSTSPPSRSSP